MRPHSKLTIAGTIFLISMLSASPGGAQATAAICKDGTTSAASGRGACSGHGGVDKTATKAAKRTVKAEVKAAKKIAKRTEGAEVTTLCADGSTSKAKGRGACSGHGGVKGAEVTSKTTGKVVAAPTTTAPTPRASATARTHASSNSAVVQGNGSKEDNNPKGAIAQCKDGLYSHAVNHRGACGHHGGVARWM